MRVMGIPSCMRTPSCLEIGKNRENVVDMMGPMQCGVTRMETLSYSSFFDELKS